MAEIMISTPIIVSGGSLEISGASTLTGIYQEALSVNDAVYVEGTCTAEASNNSGDWESTSTKITTITGTNGVSISLQFSPNGDYVVVGNVSASPYIFIYKRVGDVFTQLSGVVGGDSVDDISWMADSSYFAVALQSAPYLAVYKRTGDTFAKLTVGGAPSRAVTAVSFEPNAGEHIAYTTTAGCGVIKRTGDTFASLYSSMTSTDHSYCAEFSPDGNYVLYGENTSPYMQIFKRVGDVFTKLANVATAPGAMIYEAAWTVDSNYLVVGTGLTSGEKISIYSRSGDVFTKLPSIATQPTQSLRAITFDSNSKYLAACSSSSPYLWMYKFETETLTQITAPTAPTAAVYDVSFYENYLACAYGTATKTFLPYKATFVAGGPAVYDYKIHKSSNLISEADIVDTCAFGYVTEAGVLNDEKEIVQLWGTE